MRFKMSVLWPPVELVGLCTRSLFIGPEIIPSPQTIIYFTLNNGLVCNNIEGNVRMLNENDYTKWYLYKMSIILLSLRMKYQAYCECSQRRNTRNECPRPLILTRVTRATRVSRSRHSDKPLCHHHQGVGLGFFPFTMAGEFPNWNECGLGKKVSQFVFTWLCYCHFVFNLVISFLKFLLTKFENNLSAYNMLCDSHYHLTAQCKRTLSQNKN